LASLLWRLRRATAIESGLFEGQAGLLRQQIVSDNPYVDTMDKKLKVLFNLHPLLVRQQVTEVANSAKHGNSNSPLDEAPHCSSVAKSNLAQSFLQLADSDNGAFDRLGRYELCLWRQAAQTIVLLNSYKWRSEDARRRPRRRFRSTQQRRPHFFPANFYRQR
jgi:hypothetical protein